MSRNRFQSTSAESFRYTAAVARCDPSHILIQLQPPFRQCSFGERVWHNSVPKLRGKIFIWWGKFLKVTAYFFVFRAWKLYSRPCTFICWPTFPALYQLLPTFIIHSAVSQLWEEDYMWTGFITFSISKVRRQFPQVFSVIWIWHVICHVMFYVILCMCSAL